MNDRIRELIEQAGIHFHKGGTLDAGPNGIAKFVLYSDMEKFAELIVRECMEIAERSDGDCSHNWIKEHFGVNLKSWIPNVN